MNIERQENTVKIAETEDITASNVEGLRQSILKEMDDTLKFIELDLKDVELIDSTGISLLISIQNSLGKNEGKLKILNASKDISYMLNMMRLNQHFEIS